MTTCPVVPIVRVGRWASALAIPMLSRLLALLPVVAHAQMTDAFPT